ncbi:hypothetical protein Csa_023854, partial [Cucumis sativus]
AEAEADTIAIAIAIAIAPLSPYSASEMRFALHSITFKLLNTHSSLYQCNEDLPWLLRSIPPFYQPRSFRIHS